MVRTQIPARFGKQTLTVRTGAFCRLLLTGRKPKIRRWPAYIMDIPLKIRLFSQKPGLLYERFLASGLNNPALMKGQCAKTARSKTSSVADKTKLNLPDGRNSPFLLIGRMIPAHVWQIIYLIHLRLRQRLGRRILNHKQLFPIRLHQTLPSKGIRVAVLNKKAFGILNFILLHL